MALEAPKMGIVRLMACVWIANRLQCRLSTFKMSEVHVFVEKMFYELSSNFKVMLALRVFVDMRVLLTVRKHSLHSMMCTLLFFSQFTAHYSNEIFESFFLWKGITLCKEQDC